MKKLAFMLAVVFLSLTAFAQQKQTTPSSSTSRSKTDSTMVHQKSGTTTNQKMKSNKSKSGTTKSVKHDMNKAKSDTTKTKKY